MSTTGRDLLIVEDDADIRLFLKASLAADGFAVFAAAAGAEARAMALRREFDLFVIDLGLPDADGVDLVRAFRARSQAPILILSAQTDERRKIEALDAGADDYITKPFGIGELLARVRVALRHAARTPVGQALKLGKATVDMEKRRAVRDGAEVHLTPIEFRLLGALAKHLGMVVTHRQLLAEVWGPSHVGQTHYLRIYMKQLRDKLEEDPVRPRYLVTETGVGYRLLADEA